MGIHNRDIIPCKERVNMARWCNDYHTCQSRGECEFNSRTGRQGLLVEGLRHCSFTAVTRVRISYRPPIAHVTELVDVLGLDPSVRKGF